MAFSSPHKSKGAELDLILERWENRYELSVLTKTVPRSLIVASLIGLIICVVGYLHFRLRPEQLALINGAILGLSFLLNLVNTLLFPRPRQLQARYFDIEFGLRERISTALELLSGRIQTHPEIEAQQIADALAHARRINAREAIPLDFRPREMALLLILLMALSATILVPLVTGQLPSLDSPSPAIEAAKEELREIVEAIAKDTDLSDVDRRELLNALEIALERLQEEDISEEEAFAAMSQLSAKLEESENELGETIELEQSALEAAAEALQDFLPPGENTGDIAERSDQNDAASNLDEMSQGLEALAQDAQQMSQEESQAAAEALQEAAEQLAEINPELAERLREMAEAMQEGDSERLQELLDQAQDQLTQEQQQQQQNQNAQAMMQEQSERTEASAEEIAQQQSQQQIGDPERGPSQASETGEQRSGQPSDQQADDGQQSPNPGNQQGERNRPGQSEPQSANPDSRSAGSGAGEGEANNRSLSGSGGEDQGADMRNRTTGAGEIQYEAIYNPSGIAGGGGEEIRLRTDASDQTLAEGDFDDNPLGESRVSYDTVFNDYQNAANRALESDYVPLGLRDVVREYFTSLDPNR